MKTLATLLLSLFTLNAFACPCPDLFKEPESKKIIEKKLSVYDDFLLAKNKKNFLENTINNHIKIKEIIGQEECKLSRYKKLIQNSAVMFLQVSCKDIDDNIHLVLPKVDVIDVKIHQCSIANKKYNSYVGCKNKI